ncbi:MAG: hypothetical protein NC218_08525 [Acetobacter sp.]|nr:hypothetical protein [Acetobacter sp.]
MVATLYRQRNNKDKSIEAVTAEDNWKDVLSNWLLGDFPMPLGKYIITQGPTMATFELKELVEGGDRYVELVARQDISQIIEERNDGI